MDNRALRVKPGSRVKLVDSHANDTHGYNKEKAGRELQRHQARMAELQELLYACKNQTLLIVLQALDAGGIDPAGMVLQIEPGRSLFANCGIHLSRVCHVKRQERPVPRTWVELDTTEMFLPDLFMEHAYFRPLFASRADAKWLERVEIVGQSCNFDLLARDVEAPTTALGDVIAFLDTGAYQDAAASNFNALTRPATVLITENRSVLIKRHETLEEIFARDLPLPRSAP